jgi:thiamine biosynthesis lipoprotein
MYVWLRLPIYQMTTAFTFAAILILAGSQESPVASAPSGVPSMGIYDHEAMWTPWQFQIYARKGDRSLDEVRRIAEMAFEEVDAVERSINTWEPASEASQMNEFAATKPVRVGPILFDLLNASLLGYRETNGAFDVTVGPLLELYGFYDKKFGRPGSTKLEATLRKVGSDKLLLNSAARTVHYSQVGVRVDFGGIAKGFALDRAAETLRRYGVTSALLSGGDSSMIAIGSPPDAPAWTIAIQNPLDAENDLGDVELCDEALSTSSCYKKKAGRSRRAPCDIIDPRIGKPVDDVINVTVIGRSATEMETLSKAFLIFDRQEREVFTRNHPEIKVIILEAPYSKKPTPLRIGFSERKD